jgi:hypothetical protein
VLPHKRLWLWKNQRQQQQAGEHHHGKNPAREKNSQVKDARRKQFRQAPLDDGRTDMSPSDTCGACRSPASTAQACCTWQGDDTDLEPVRCQDMPHSLIIAPAFGFVLNVGDFAADLVAMLVGDGKCVIGGCGHGQLVRAQAKFSPPRELLGNLFLGSY